MLKQYTKLMELDGVELEFTEEALTAVAEKALKRSTGARALKSVLETVMLNLMYEVPSKKNIEKIVITAESIRGNGEPVIYYRETA